MKRQFSTQEARAIGDMIGVDFTRIGLEQFRIGLGVELEHGQAYPETNVTDDDWFMTGRIAWAHLREIPDYYDRLARMEREAKREVRAAKQAGLTQNIG